MGLAIKPMVNKEAREWIGKISANTSNIRYLVLEFFEREGWMALGYISWRECVMKEFNPTKQRYLYYQLAAAQAERNICTIVQTIPIPEGQLRPLVKLKNNPGQQREAWQKAVETANGKVTAVDVMRAVKEIQSSNSSNKLEPNNKELEPKELELKPRIPEYAIVFAKTAICHLERISSDDPTRGEGLALVSKWIKLHKYK